MNFRERESLDRYITGNYGENQFKYGGADDDWLEVSAHEEYILNLPSVYLYDSAHDGPECEIITRILAKHPLYIPGLERPAIVVSRCLELVSLLRYKKSFNKLTADENLAVHRAVAIMLVTHQ